MQKLNISELKAKLNELKGGNASKNYDFMKKFYNPPDWNETLAARSTIRILPGAINSSGENSVFFTETLLHKINGKNYHCPKKIGQPCPICEYNRALWATEDQENIKIARELKAKKKFYMNVIAREREVIDEKTGDKQLMKNNGPLIYSCGVKVFEKILKFMVDEDYGDITDLENGYDFQIRKEKQGEWPNYDDSKARKDPSPAGTKEEIEEWMNNLHDLSILIRHESYNEIKHQLDIYRGIITDPFSLEQSSTTTTGNSEVDQPTRVNDSSETKTTDSTESPEEDDFFKELEKLRQNQ